MIQAAVVSHRADDIYRTGPETLIAQSSTILSGPVSSYSRKEESRSQGGADSIPLKWVVSGMLEKPHVFKGQAPSGAIRFSRSEQSIVLPKDPSTADWEAVYGELASDGQVVIFLGGTSPASILKVLPSGADEQNLIGLVEAVVQIQAVADPSERVKRWLSYLKGAPSAEGQKAALRSFIAEGGEWTELDPVLDQSLKNSRLSRDFRAFGFGIIAFNVTQERWGASRDAVLDFLCRIFATERDPKLAMQYLYSLGLIFNYCDDEDFRTQRRTVRRRVEGCLEQRPSLKTSGGPPVERYLEEQYQKLRSKYLQR
jgi:hypothetical protein